MDGGGVEGERSIGEADLQDEKSERPGGVEYPVIGNVRGVGGGGNVGELRCVYTSISYREQPEQCLRGDAGGCPGYRVFRRGDRIVVAGWCGGGAGAGWRSLWAGGGDAGSDRAAGEVCGDGGGREEGGAETA